MEIKERWTGEVLWEGCVREGLIAAARSGADLSRAYLSGADLSGALGVNPNLVTPLLLMFDQPGEIRAYKLVNSSFEGPFRGGIAYEVGKFYDVPNADTNSSSECGAGINLATLDWCMREWIKGYRILVAEFTAADIAAIPTATDGKFRVRRCKIVAEKDLVEIGLIENWNES